MRERVMEEKVMGERVMRGRVAVMLENERKTVAKQSNVTITSQILLFPLFHLSILFVNTVMSIPPYHSSIPAPDQPAASP
jgi:hypothetical protein